MKVSNRDLNNLFSMAKASLNETADRGLDNQEALAKAWLLAVSRYLGIDNKYQFPHERLVPIPDDED